MSPDRLSGPQSAVTSWVAMLAQRQVTIVSALRVSVVTLRVAS